MTFLLDRSIIRHAKTSLADTSRRRQQIAQSQQRLHRDHGRA
jgi:hypothetical protein